MHIDTAIEHLGHHTHIESLDIMFIIELSIGTHTIAVDISVDNRLEDKLRIALVVLHEQSEIHSRGILTYEESHCVDRNTVNIHLIDMPTSAHAFLW